MTALATGVLGYYRIYKSDGTTCSEEGSVTGTGGGGDMTVSNVNTTTGQNVQITTFTLTEP